MLVVNPFFGFRLIAARCRYFVTRSYAGSLTTPSGFVIENENELVSYWNLFVERECYDPTWVADLKSTDVPLVIDVGANAGVFSDWIRVQNHSAEIIAFEPLPKMAAKVKSWKERVGAKLTLHEVAVANQRGRATFFAGAENDTTASLRPITPKPHSLEVNVVTLDETLPELPILMLKIDVEGCECDVIEGASRVLLRSKYLLVEAHTDEALAQIELRLGNKWAKKQVGASDFLFSKLA